MKDATFLIFELITAVARLIGPGGSRAIIAADSALLLSQKITIPPDALDDLTEIPGDHVESSGPSSRSGAF